MEIPDIWVSYENVQCVVVDGDAQRVLGFLAEVVQRMVGSTGVVQCLLEREICMKLAKEVQKVRN